ncbi:TPA: hypothetical protein NV714_003832 [Escherichia coli]|nr:hypothetical protein [Escherichia coli]
MAPIIFNIVDCTKRKTKKTLPSLWPSESFEEVTRKIKRHFISNMEDREYSKLLASYKKFAQKFK